MRRVLLFAFLIAALAAVGPGVAFGGGGKDDGKGNHGKCPPGLHQNGDYCENNGGHCPPGQNGHEKSDYCEDQDCDTEEGKGGDDKQHGEDCRDHQNPTAARFHLQRLGNAPLPSPR